MGGGGHGGVVHERDKTGKRNKMKGSDHKPQLTSRDLAAVKVLLGNGFVESPSTKNEYRMFAWFFFRAMILRNRNIEYIQSGLDRDTGGTDAVITCGQLASD